MKWSIPAKTFFLGEYAALSGLPAIVLTTTPCFELTLSEEPGLVGIHPDSPAGLFWTKQPAFDKGLAWFDPYHGRGGLGASSAQFVGAYLASSYLKQASHSQADMLNQYFQCAWSGIGVRPSGYDVLAQSMQGCVYIHQQAAQYQAYPWPFKDLAFILLHTGEKLATHQHLQGFNQPSQMTQLACIVESARSAFELSDSSRIIDAVNSYHQNLLQMKLVAPHSVHQIDHFKNQTNVLAIKGCGAMGSDVILMLVPEAQLGAMCTQLEQDGSTILATSIQIYGAPCAKISAANFI